jgi:hypothetical protein
VYTFYFLFFLKSFIVFSINPITGTNINHPKYNIEQLCPIIIYGASTGLAPTHPNNKKLAKNIHNTNFDIGWNWLPLILDISMKGIANNINIAPNIAITPNNLFGIDLNIA